MRCKIKTLLVNLVTVLVLATAEPVLALPVVQFTGVVRAGTEGGIPGSVRGWAFDVVANEGITVSHLSIYDRNADGLAVSHDIAICTSDGTMIISGTVPTGEAAPLDKNGMFRLVNIDDVLLPQADNYVIAAYYRNGFDGFESQVSGLSLHPSLEYVDKRVSVHVFGFEVPLTAMADPPGYFGPSFEIAPEPSTIALATLSVLGLVVCNWRRCRR